MITFDYTARDIETGEPIQAEVQAENEQAAARLLISRNLFPVSIIEKGKGGASRLKARFGNRVKSKDKVLFTRQLATLINAGLPILQSLRSVQEQVSNPFMQSVIAEVTSDVEGGSSLANAFGKHPGVFSPTYASLVAAGETSGTLDKTLDRLAFQMEKDAQIYSKIRGAMVYPAIVLGVIVLVMIFLLTVVLPQIGLVYRDFNRELPFVTQILLSVSGLISRLWWLFTLGIAGGAVALRRYIKTPQGRRRFDSLKLNLPVLGKLFQKVYMARFCRGMATLLSSGVQMLNSLETVKGTLNNRVIADSLDEVAKDVRGGKSLSSTLAENPLFLKVVPQMIKIGEDSGAVDDVLDKLATYFENEIDETVKTLSTSVEPTLMVVMGITVGSIMAAVLLPIYGLVNTGIL